MNAASSYILLFSLLSVALSSADVGLPDTDSLYSLQIAIGASCSRRSLSGICEALRGLNYASCSLISQGCSASTKYTIDVEASYTGLAITAEQIRQDTSSISIIAGVNVEKIEVTDVNECSRSNGCSSHSYCINQPGFYSCQCYFAYTDSTSSSLNGTVCVQRCHPQQCGSYSKCSEGTTDGSDVSCDCPHGYSGSYCNIRSSSFPQWAVIVIAVITVIAALVGIGLCAFSCYHLFCKRSEEDESEARSISDYKPKSLPHEYAQFTDTGSFSRVSAGAARNRGFVGTIDEEDEIESPYIRNDGLKFGAAQLERRLSGPREPSEPSEHGDPTPVLHPIGRTDRHALSDIASQPDYY